MNQNELIKAARTGDKNAFAELYIKYKDSMYRSHILSLKTSRTRLTRFLRALLRLTQGLLL